MDYSRDSARCLRCADCGEVEGTHAANCIRLRERGYKAPKKVKHYNKTAPIDYEATAGRRRENKEKL